METKKKNNEWHFSVFMHNFRRTLPRLIWIPVLLTALAAGYRYYTVSHRYIPVYETFAVYRVSANKAGSIDLNSYRYYLDTNAASKIAATYPYVMSSDQSKELLKEKYSTPSLSPGRMSRVVADTASPMFG